MAAPVTKGEELELEVDSLAFGGNGVARLDGFVVFVRRGLPGDRVRARVTKVKRSHAEALATAIWALVTALLVQLFVEGGRAWMARRRRSSAVARSATGASGS